MFELTLEQRDEIVNMLLSKDEEIHTLKRELAQYNELKKQHSKVLKDLEKQTKLLKESDATLGLVLGRLKDAHNKVEAFNLINRNTTVKVNSVREFLDVRG